MTELLTFGGLVVTVLLAYLQIQKNHAATLRAQEAHLRDQLKVNVYEKVAAVFQDCAEQVNTAAGEMRSVVSNLRLALQGLPGTQRLTSAQLLDVHYNAQRALSRVLLVLEQYEIVFARFASIRRQFSDEHGRLLDVHVKLWVALVPLIPIVDSSSGRTTPPLVAPTQSALDVLEPLATVYIDVCGDIMGYFIDLQIEAQNELLGHLFQHQLPPRSPGDPRQRVLVRDAIEPTERPRGRIV